MKIFNPSSFTLRPYIIKLCWQSKNFQIFSDFHKRCRLIILCGLISKKEFLFYALRRGCRNAFSICLIGRKMA